MGSSLRLLGTPGFIGARAFRPHRTLLRAGRPRSQKNEFLSCRWAGVAVRSAVEGLPVRHHRSAGVPPASEWHRLLADESAEKAAPTSRRDACATLNPLGVTRCSE